MIPSWKLLSPLLLAISLFASGNSLAATKRVADVAKEFEEVEGLIIDSIEIDNRNIYDTENDRYRSFFFRLANKLHVVSRVDIIKRELLLKMGEPFSSELAEESARNLRARYAINDAWIETEKLDKARLLVRVVTIDQWSLVGGVEFKRDGNESKYTIGLEERNLLGSNQFLKLKYSIYETEANFVTTTFRDSRVGGKLLSLQVDYSNESTDELKRIRFSRPFYRLSQTVSFSLTASSDGGRRDVYNDGSPIGQWNVDGDFVGARMDFRRGEHSRKIGLKLAYNYRYLVSTNETVFDSSMVSLVSFPTDSIYHQFEVGLNFFDPIFVKERRINGFGYTEDFTLGWASEVNVARAFAPDFGDHVLDRLEARLGFGGRFSHHLVLASMAESYWFRADHKIRRLTEFSFRLYNNRLEYLTLAARATFLSDWRVNKTNGLNLGGTTGLRGYDRFFQSGNRMIVTSFEGRFFPGIELLSVQVGGAVFVDAGRAWPVGERMSLDGFSSSIGLGLRLSFEKLARSELLRIDVALAQGNRWELSLSSGQYF